MITRCLKFRNTKQEVLFDCADVRANTHLCCSHVVKHVFSWLNFKEEQYRIWHSSVYILRKGPKDIKNGEASGLCVCSDLGEGYEEKFSTHFQGTVKPEKHLGSLCTMGCTTHDPTSSVELHPLGHLQFKMQLQSLNKHISHVTSICISTTSTVLL